MSSNTAKPGRVKPVTAPGFGTFAKTYEPDVALAVVLGVWLDTTAAEHLLAAEFHAPILERWVNGRCIERAVVTFGWDFIDR